MKDDFREGMKSLSRHIRTHMMTIEDYYQRFLMSEMCDVVCICGKIKKFGGLGQGYRKFCSSICAQNFPETREKCVKTNMKRYGGSSPSSSSEVRRKIENTCFKKFGCKSPSMNAMVLEKQRSTMISHFGVPYAMQNLSSHEKQQKSCYLAKDIMINGKIFSCRGFEERFLRECDKFGFTLNEISKDVPSIFYEDRENKHRYIPDFFVKRDSSVIEIKSNYTFDGCGKRHDIKEVNLKKFRAVTSMGLKLIVIIYCSNETIVATNLEELESITTTR